MTEPMVDMVKRGGVWAYEETRTQAALYFKKVKQAFLKILLISVVFMILIAIGSTTDTDWLVRLSKIALIGAAGALLLMVTPVLILTNLAYTHSKIIRGMVTFASSVALWFLIVATYFYLLPYEKSPALGAVAMMAIASLFLSHLVFGRSINPTLVIATRWLILAVVTILVFVPGLRTEASDHIENFNDWLAAPKEKFYDENSIWQLEFYNKATGKPKIWYYIDANGHYMLFDRHGYYWGNGQEFKLSDHETQERAYEAFLKRKQAQNKISIPPPVITTPTPKKTEEIDKTQITPTSPQVVAPPVVQPIQPTAGDSENSGNEAKAEIKTKSEVQKSPLETPKIEPIYVRYTVPESTQIKTRLLNTLDSDFNLSNDLFGVVLTEKINNGRGKTLVESGFKGIGRVLTVRRSSQNEYAHLEIELTSLILPHFQEGRIPIRTKALWMGFPSNRYVFSPTDYLYQRLTRANADLVHELGQDFGINNGRRIQLRLNQLIVFQLSQELALEFPEYPDSQKK